MTASSNRAPVTRSTNLHRQNGFRWLVAGLLPLICILLHLMPFWLFGEQLPDRVASHFDINGTPDGSMTPQELLFWTGVSLLFPGILMMVAAGLLSRRMPRPWPPFLTGLGVFLAVLGVGACTNILYSQQGIAQWQDAESPGVGLIIALVVAAFAAAGAAMLGKGLPYNTGSTIYAAEKNSKRPAMPLAHGERALFVETISASWLLWLTAVTLLVCVVMVFLAVWPVAVVVGLTALPLLLLSSMRVQADRNGLSIRSALLGWRFVTIDVADIEQAAVIDVNPLKWGGWGYRGSLKLAGSAAVVLRSGPGLHLQMSNDRTFVVTLDDPEGAAAVLNGIRSNNSE